MATESYNDCTLAEQEDEVIHRCPPKDSGVMPCCGRTPFEVPHWHRMTLDPKSVTCGGLGEQSD